MNIFETITNRRSIRYFKTAATPEKEIAESIEAVRWAPSAGNLQSRKFYFVLNDVVKKELAHTARDQDFIAEAPLMVVACLDRAIFSRYGHRGVNLYSIQDVSASVMSMMLAVYGLWFGSVWVGWFNERDVIEILDLPLNPRPIAIVPVGYTANTRTDAEGFRGGLCTVYTMICRRGVDQQCPADRLFTMCLHSDRTWCTIRPKNMKTLRPSIVILLLFLMGCAAPMTATTRAHRSDSSFSLNPENDTIDSPLVAASVDQRTDDEDAEDDVAAPEGTKTAAAPGEESLLDTALELTERAREFWTMGDTEKAIEALDHAYALILKAPVDADEKSTQQKDDLRFMISKRLTEIYTSRLTAVNGKDKEIPLVVNEHVEQEIKLFQTVDRDFFLESYQRSGKYRDEMAKAFREAGIPEEISWLPMIESGFKARALSRARALGLWQFIPSTGYKFGLKRTAWVDERLDPAKATAAAIAYLRELHEVFGDWATVLAAYNCGEGNVFRVIRQQKINYLDNFWDLYERLPRETARYYPRFLAVLVILKDPSKYGFTLGERDKPVPYEVVSVEKPLQLRKVAEKIGCAHEDLADLNAELRQAATPNTSYDLKVPVGMKDAVLASLDSLPSWSPPKPLYVYHRVRRGETLSTIAIRYRSSVQRIVEANNLRSGRMIRAGQNLKIPVRNT